MIAIPVIEEGEDPRIDERFGRCSQFCLIDSNSNKQFIINKSKDETSGAGGLTVKLLADNNVTTVISPHIGPKAMDAIKALGIKAFNKEQTTRVSQALELFYSGKLQEMGVSSGLRRV